MTVKFGLRKPLCTFVYEWLISGTGKPISVATNFQSFGHTRLPGTASGMASDPFRARAKFDWVNLEIKSNGGKGALL